MAKPKHMTLEQEAHLASLKVEACALMDAKYRAGQQEHGGDLLKKPGVLDMAIAEAVDLVVYLLTLRQQLESPAVVGLWLPDPAWLVGRRSE